MDWRETMLIFGLTLILIKTAACVDRFCMFNQSDPCFTAVGEKLSLQILLDARGVDLGLYKGPSGNGVNIFRLKNSKDSDHESIRNRCEFFSDKATLVINSVIAADSGIYRLEIYDLGIGTFQQHLHVYIEGVDRFCRFNQSDPCFTAVGEKLNLQLVQDTQDIELELYKGERGNGLRVFRLKNNKGIVHESIRNRFIFNTATLTINNVIAADSGIYRLEIYNTNGMKTFEQHLHLTIEVPVWFEVFVPLWCSQMMVLLGLLGGFHIYMRHTAGKKRDDQNLRMRRFDEGHEDS